MTTGIEYFGNYGILHPSNGDNKGFSVVNFKLVSSSQGVSIRKVNYVLFVGSYDQCANYIKTNCVSSNNE